MRDSDIGVSTMVATSEQARIVARRKHFTAAMKWLTKHILLVLTLNGSTYLVGVAYIR